MGVSGDGQGKTGGRRASSRQRRQTKEADEQTPSPSEEAGRGTGDRVGMAWPAACAPVTQAPQEATGWRSARASVVAPPPRPKPPMLPMMTAVAVTLPSGLAVPMTVTSLPARDVGHGVGRGRDLGHRGGGGQEHDLRAAGGGRDRHLAGRDGADGARGAAPEARPAGGVGPAGAGEARCRWSWSRWRWRRRTRHRRRARPRRTTVTASGGASAWRPAGRAAGG